MEAIAKTRHLKGSPRKARLVIDLIRGRNVSQALNILKFTDKRAAEPIEKTLRSAIANATYLAEQQNIAIDPDDLFVKTCFVDMGAHKNRRRMRPAPQGRAFREQRHYCHITILVSNDAASDVKSAKKSLQVSGEKGDGGAKGKNAPKPEAAVNIKAATQEMAKTEKPAIVEPVEEKAPIVETPVISDPVAEMMDTKKAPEVGATEIDEAESDLSDVADTNSPKDEANTDTDKQKAEASNAKNVQSQTSAERNETKKADDAQLNENDILELK